MKMCLLLKEIFAGRFLALPAPVCPETPVSLLGWGADGFGTLTCVCLDITSSTKAQLLTSFKPRLGNKGTPGTPRTFFRVWGGQTARCMGQEGDGE